MNTQRTPPVHCVNASCGKLLDAASHEEEGVAPAPGDFTVCLYCGTFYRFVDTLSLQVLTEEQIAELPDASRNELVRTRFAIQALNASRVTEGDPQC